MLLGRRAMVGHMGLGAVSLMLGARSASAQASRLPVRLSRSGPGTAGTLRDGVNAKYPEVLDGLDVTWVDGDPGQLQFFILSGALSCGPFGALGVAEAAQKGADLVLFGPSLNNHGSWVVRADSPYHEPRDLRGKRIATQLPTSDTYRHARMAAALHKLDLRKDFEFVFGPPIANIALFRRGDVDAIISIEPTTTRLIAEGHREIASVAGMWRSATGDAAPLSLVSSASSRKWFEGNRETARRVAELARRGNRIFLENPEIVRDPVVYELMGFRATDTEALRLLPSRLPRIYPTEWNKSVFEGLERQIDVALDLGIIEKRPSRAFYEQFES